MVKRLLVLLMAVGAMVVGATVFVALPAHADAITTAEGKLSPSNPVYVAPDAEVTVKKSAVNGSDVPMAVAALPSSVGDPAKVATQLENSVFGQTKGVMIVFSGTAVGSANGFTGNAHDEVNQIGKAVYAKDKLAKGDDASGFVGDVVSGINKAKAADESASGDKAAAGSTDNKGGGHTGLIVFLVIVLLVIGGAGAWVVTKRRRKRQHLADRRAEVVSYYDRLGADVQNLYAGGDEVTQQALADAAERYTATGAQLAQANSDAQFDSARRTALEGLQAARTARRRLGLDPGPDLPPIAPTRGEKLTEEQEYQVGDRTVRGHPDYEPGAPYYYGGGGGYGAGWYSFPFWETLLLTSALSGGFGGWGGGGYGSGYDQGFEAGEEHANDENDNSGGDNSGWDSGGSGWDSGGGSDWGGGGSDWGGDSGGGGDWGGGGGDGGW